jgi:hypothetical protein
MFNRRVHFCLWASLVLVLLGTACLFHQIERRFPQNLKAALAEWNRANHSEILLADMHGTPLLNSKEPASHGELPSAVKQIFITAEDQTFYHHRGITVKGSLRALWHNLSKSKLAEGGSTITQQLMRMSLLKREKTILRKVVEIILSIKAERQLTKREIFDLWINNAYFGSEQYGIRNAARYYYNKSPDTLTVGEAVTLAALLPAPARLIKSQAFTELQSRRWRLLSRLIQGGAVTKREGLVAHATIPKFVIPTTRKPNAFPWIAAVTTQQARSIKSASQMIHGPTLTTTIDLQMQTKLDQIAASLNKKYGRSGYEIAAVAIDAHTGQTRALVGGLDFSRNQFNRAISAKRPFGTAIVPILYGLAMESGIVVGTDGKTLGVQAIESRFQEVDHLIFDLGPSQIRAYLQPFTVKLPQDEFSLEDIQGSPWALAQVWRSLLGRPARITKSIAIKDESSGTEVKNLSPGFDDRTAFILRYLLQMIGEKQNRNILAFQSSTGWDAWNVVLSPNHIYVFWGGIDRPKVPEPKKFKKLVDELHQTTLATITQMESSQSPLPWADETARQRISWQLHKVKGQKMVKVPLSLNF